MVSQRDALAAGLGWPHRGEPVTVTTWRYGADAKKVTVSGAGIYLGDHDIYLASHQVWLPELSSRPHEGSVLVCWHTGPGDDRQIGPADPAGDIGLRLQAAPGRKLPLPLMRWPKPEDAGITVPGRVPAIPLLTLFDVGDVPGLATSRRTRDIAPRPRRVPAGPPEEGETLF
jgi:hypothetical protein